MTTSSALLSAITAAETGGEANPFIRTKVQPKGGSTAYGPAQITGTLAKDFLEKRKELFDKDEIAYLRRFIKQADLFAKFGGEPNKKGYDPRYDYGGEGDLTSDEDRELYNDVAQKMVGFIHTKNKGDIEQTIKEWRFGAASKKGRQTDPKYFQRVEENLQTTPVQEGEVLTEPLVDIEGEVRRQIQAQLATLDLPELTPLPEENVAQTGSQELTEEDQEIIEWLKSSQQETPVEPEVSQEDQEIIEWLKTQGAQAGTVQPDPTDEDFAQDVVLGVFG